MSKQARHAGVGWEVSPSQQKLEYIARYPVGKTVLDIGCGRGFYASRLADAGFDVTGMDLENRVEDPRIAVIEGPITAPLPFADNVFDTVLMFDILEHLEDEPGILTEVSRVCRRRLLLSVPHSDPGSLPTYGLTYLHYTDPTHLREYTIQGLNDILSACGFMTIKCGFEGHFAQPMVFSEFLRGGPWVQKMARNAIHVLFNIGLIYNDRMGSDIYYMGDKSRSDSESG